MAKAEWLLLCLLAGTRVCNAAKILVVFPFYSKSHGILGEALVKHLLNAGHEITYITPFPKNGSNPKLHEIDVSTSWDMFEEQSDDFTITSLMETFATDWMYQPIFFFLTDSTLALRHDNVQKLLRDQTQHFDMVIAEWMFNELYAGLAGLYDAHLVWFSTLDPHWMILTLIDDYTNPAYNGYIVDGCPPFTFVQRLDELWFMLLMSVVRETAVNYLQTSEYNSLIVPLIEARGRVAPSFSELRYSTTLVLGNSHVSIGHAIRLPQSYKAVGGYHIDEEVKPLPEDLKKLLDSAEHGLIYFSMGSNFESKDMTDELKKSLLEVFGSLKQTVLWKFEEKFPELPENVHIIEWAPQQSILAHPNCVLFITHGGLLSTTESVFAGKPIIGIPVFADQFTNVAKAVAKGVARRVDISDSMGDQLKIEIEEILNNPKYAQKAAELSIIYHDRPATPSQDLVHWVNHVLKTGGAPHLRSPALMVPWYQKCYLDLAILITIAIIVLKKVMKMILSLRKQKKSNSKKNN